MSALLTSLPPALCGLASDPELPQRDQLLDEQQMAARLSSLIERDGPAVIDHCEIQRIKYRIGESLRVLYRVSVNGCPQLVAAKVSAVRAAFWKFPNDRKIKHLSLLRDTPQVLSQALVGKWRHSELVAYVPEKCATVKCQDRDGETIAYAKMYAPGEGQSVAKTYSQLASVCPQVVKPLEYSEPHQLLLLEPVAGRRIADLENDELNDGFAGLAQALAALHAAPIPRHLPRFRRHDAERLRNCTQIVATARPDVATLANQLERDLRSTSPSAAPLVCLHGDVHPKNGIALNDLVTLIDLDQSAVGPAAADLASMLALLHYNWRTGLITRRTERELARVFLDAYAESQPLPTQRSLSWHTAAALLSERALRSVNRIRPEGLRQLSQLLNDAREILRTGGVSS
jgi:aminoglycoside phosphotransferase